MTKTMTKQEVMDYFGFTDRLCMTVLSARLDYIGRKTYTLSVGDEHYSITKSKNGYEVKHEQR